jgi:hypothetical protein
MGRLLVVACAAFAIGTAGCAIDASLEGKRCPCAEGWSCDAHRGECVRNTCEPTVQVNALSPSWATAHDVRWTWAPSGPAGRFARYELWVARTEEDLASRSGTALMFGSASNPELGTYVLPVAGDILTSTVTRGLAAGAAHYAQLVVVDVDQCSHASAVVVRTTMQEPQNAITLFDDALPPGAETAPSPPALEVSSNGGSHLEYVALEDEDCVPAEADLEDVKATCGQPLRVRGFSEDVSFDPDQTTLTRLSPGMFGDAYLEMRVHIEGPVPSWFTTVWLANAVCLPFETAIFRSEAFTLPNLPEGVTIEVPLAVLDRDGGLLTYGALDTQAGGTQLCGFGVAGTWHKTGIVRLDDVMIRF